MRLVLAVTGAVAFLAVAGQAQAHAEPDEIRPGDGAVVTTLPAKVEIVMSQELARQAGSSDIDVFGPNGTEVTTEAATLDLKDRRRISVALPAGLEPGKYTVRWKSLSAADGDPANGELAFTYDPKGSPSTGREQLDVEAGSPPAEAPGDSGDLSAFATGEGSDNAAWVAAVAAGIAGLAIGGSVVFLLVQRQPRRTA